jgi:hypothetical protein
MKTTEKSKRANELTSKRVNKFMEYLPLFTCLLVYLFTYCNSRAQQSFLTLAPDLTSTLESIPSDIYVRPATATVSPAAQSGEGIQRTYDRDYETLYHSNYYNTTFPITLEYRFSQITPSIQIDYAIYYPRMTGSNGNFKEVEVQYELWSQSGTFVKVGDYNLAGGSSPFVFNFVPALEAPRTIRFIVKSGTGNFASCAEMEFYKKSPEEVDFSTHFTDKSCSRLKPGTTLDDIKGISNLLYQKLASDLYYREYDTIFRTQSYEAYQIPGLIAQAWKTVPYGRNDNPTGIYAEAGKDLIVMMEALNGRPAPGLFIQTDGAGIQGKFHILKEGANRITPTNTGLVYLHYYTATGTEAPININFVTGKVNGYFDSEIHETADWQPLLNKALAPCFDLKGRYASLNFETTAYKTYTPDGLALINHYDSLVRWEQDFMGIYKYNRRVRNHAHFQVIYDSYMYATDYYTAYVNSAQNIVLSLPVLLRQSWDNGTWGPAHELGHVHQTRPGLKWLGMTEITNNIMSQYIVTQFGLPSRLQFESGGYYARAVNEIVKNADMAHNLHTDFFCKLVPFWQLQLYFSDVLGNKDFYKDIYEKVRVNPDPKASDYSGCTVDGACQLEFVRLVCEVSGYDLRQFFTDWKFLKPVNARIEDYSTATFTVSQAGIDALNAKISAMNLPLPPIPDGKLLYQITDNNKEEFK